MFVMWFDGVWSGDSWTKRGGQSIIGVIQWSVLAKGHIKLCWSVDPGTWRSTLGWPMVSKALTRWPETSPIPTLGLMLCTGQSEWPLLHATDPDVHSCPTPPLGQIGMLLIPALPIDQPDQATDQHALCWPKVMWPGLGSSPLPLRAVGVKWTHRNNLLTASVCSMPLGRDPSVPLNLLYHVGQPCDQGSWPCDPDGPTATQPHHNYPRLLLTFPQIQSGVSLDQGIHQLNTSRLIRQTAQIASAVQFNP